MGKTMSAGWLCCFAGLLLLLISSCLAFTNPALPLRVPLRAHAQHRPRAMRVGGISMQQQPNSRNELTPLKMAASDAATGDVVKVSKRNQYELSIQQKVYVWLTGVFVTCLLTADVIGVKLFEIPLPFEIFGFKTIEHTCGMLTFPITFMLGDVINEYYGTKAAKQTVYIGLAMSMLVFLVMNVAQAMPYLDAPFNVSKESFDQIFGSSKVMYIASICAYLVGSLCDIAVFNWIKKNTDGNLLWLRATGSTVVSQILDSLVVTYLAFSLGKQLTGQEAASLTQVFQIAATGYGLKFFLAMSVTPLIYVTRDILHDKFGLEAIPVDEMDEQ